MNDRFAKSLPTFVDSVYRRASDDGTTVQWLACVTSPYQLLEHMDDVPNNEIMDDDQSSAAFIVNREGELVAAS